MNKFNYIPIKLIVPEGRLPKSFKEGCEYINIGYYLGRDEVIGALEQSTKRGPGLNIWENIKPINGEYYFEVIVELPFFLPNFKKSQEYDLTIENRKYYINNRHCEIITTEKDKYIFAHFNSIKSLTEQGKEINQIIKLKTLISHGFKIEAENASFVIENNFYNWLNQISNDISGIISTLRYCSDKSPELIPDCTNIINTCPIYILCKGNENQIGLFRFIAHLNASPLQPLSHITKATKPEIEKYLSGENNLDEGRHLLLKSKQLYESGEHHASCILACTACEVIMTTHLKAALSKKGLGISKTKEAIDNLTFSQLIKLTSNFVYRKGQTVSEALSKINKIRGIRNGIVHEGKELTQKDISAIKSSFDSIEVILKKKA